VKALKSLVGKTVSTISKKVEPVAAGMAQQASQKASMVGTTVSKSPLKKIVKILVIILLIIILAFVLLSIFRLMGNQGKSDGEPGTTSRITPTPIVYQPYRPSVYAEDPEIASLELEITVLENELFRSNIREDRLFPPRLDFEIKFD
jgi:ABC-type cobalt transport system substrate-binding protein